MKPNWWSPPFDTSDMLARLRSRRVVARQRYLYTEHPEKWIAPPRRYHAYLTMMECR